MMQDTRERWRALVAVVFAVTAMALPGCGSQDKAAASATSTDYVFVYLKTGPATDKTPEERQEIFRGHMSNMQRLADEGKLIVAGPFNKPNDATWRGIFIMDTPTVAQARELVATDPGIKSGVFIMECRPFRASPALRKTLDLEKELKAKGTPQAKPGEPPPNIRGYVMVTSRDAHETARAIARSAFAGKVVWCGLMDPDKKSDQQTTAGVFVLDATDVGAVKPELPEDALGGSIDGWWSTTTLVQLPEAARVLP
ncbi:MAG: YciI family protein [Phycisphaerales bacterium]|nr:YciI family protein [Phycisphaerales bacterium]